MNKKQKKNLVKSRRFHQKVCKKMNGIVHVVIDTETGGLDGGPIDVKTDTIVNTDIVHRLTLKEIEYILNKHDVEGNSLVIDALTEELTERRLLLDK